jgi:hypothetical protein
MTELQQLAMPLSCSQVEAASRFWKEKGGWASPEIAKLKLAFPSPQDAVKIKCIVVNVLYGTNIIAILKVSDCVERVLKENHSTGSDLVEELVAEIWQITKRRNYSFSSKYAHLFINRDLPILDSYAEWMVSKHLGQIKSKNTKRYLKFAEAVEALKKAASLTCNCAELDAYLWVAGEYWSWKVNPKLNISGDLRPNFERLAKDPESESTLCNLLGIAVDSVPGLIAAILT